MPYLLLFIFFAAIIVFSGKKLSIYGDAIGDIKGFEKSWIGVILLASITSLPELITSISATVMGNPDMAVSNVFGSNLFNIFIIFILDVFVVKKISFSSSISHKNFVTAFFSILLTIIFLIGYAVNNLNILQLNIASLLIFMTYFISIKLIYTYEHEYMEDVLVVEEEVIEEDKPKLTYEQAKLGFLKSSILVVLSGVCLSFLGDKIAGTPIFGISLGESFVGVVLLALATSLPELTVSIHAVKMGSYNMAAGNILGSNVFNVSIIFFTDLFYIKGPIYDKLGDFHIISACFSMLILLCFMVGILFNKKKVKYDSFIIGIVYLVSMYILYIKR